MKKILKLIKRYEEIIRYVIIGFFTTLVSLISYYILIKTILNPNDAIQLQIANIISWILAVSFAFITNKKIVFKSYKKDIKGEAIKFFASRITTLVIDIIFMFLTVTILHFNPTGAKMLVQFIILVLNYLLSKFFVFNESNSFNRKLVAFFKKNKTIISITIALFLISFLFPFSGDDWTWKLEQLSINKLIEFSKNIDLNGRYFGNIIVTILTKSKIVRGIFLSTVLTGIFQIINKKMKIDYIYIALLLLIMPLDVLRQSIVWTSGFANYALSTLILLLILYLYQKLWNINKFKVKKAISLFILSFIGSLIIENMTIFLVMFGISINIINLIKFKRININYMLSLLGTITGAILMFIHPVYLNVLIGNDTYRTVTTSTGTLIERVFYNYSSVMRIFAIDKVIFIFASMLIIMFLYYLRNKLLLKHKKVIAGLFLYEYVYIIYVLIKTFNPNWEILLRYTPIFDSLISILFILGFILLNFMIYRKKGYNVYFIITCILGLIAPLCVVTPIGARNFFMIYILEMMLLFNIYRISDLNIEKKYVRNCVGVSIVILLLYYINVYSYITIVNYRREKYIKQNVDQEIVFVPRLPYDEYIWCPDFYGYRAADVKRILNVPQEMEFEFIDYSSWKTMYYNNKEK